jgi:hypothetical protein
MADETPRATLQDMVESVRLFQRMRRIPRSPEATAEFKKIEEKYENFIPMLCDYIDDLYKYRRCLKRLEAPHDYSA